MRKFKNVAIKEIFVDCPSDKTLTKEKIQTLTGNYPLYTATVGKPLGMVDFYNNTKPALLVVNDGAAGSTFIVKDKKFALGKHVTGLTLKEDVKNLILLEYVQIVAQPLFISKNKSEGRGNLPKQDIMKVVIPLPIDNQGKYDLIQQTKLVEKYTKINEQKAKLIEKRNQIESIQIEFARDFNTVNVKFNDLFKLKRGKIISKEMIHNNPGIYPVFSTQLDGAFGKINTYMYDGEYLLWNTDGLAGYIRHVNGKFSLTNIVGIMLFNKGIDKSSIDLRYIKNYLEPIFRSNIKGRMGANGKHEYTKLNSTMIKDLDIVIPIPVKEDGTYDLEIQRELSDKIELVEKQKKMLIQKLEYLIGMEVLIDY